MRIRATTVTENNQRTRRKSTEVYECGQRVHGWALLHDLAVGAAGDFKWYWERAQANQ